MSGNRTLVDSKFNTPMNRLQADFLTRNRVATSYHGPVYVVEDVHVLCSLCRTPVDPVTRIPVGNLYFHPRCLRCSVCDKPAKDQAFAAVEGQPVCNECTVRGFKPRTKLSKSQYANSAKWNERADVSCFHGSRTPSTALTDRAYRLQQRQALLLTNDQNVLVRSSAHGDDPSQEVAYINNPQGIMARRKNSGTGSRRKSGSTPAPNPPPARLLLPSLSTPSAKLSSASRPQSRDTQGMSPLSPPSA